MSEAEREEYLRKKREERKQEIREKMRKRLADASKVDVGIYNDC